VGWLLQLNDDDGGIQTVSLLEGFSGVDGKWRAPAGAIALREWQHICVSYDRSSTSNDPVFYVNGTTRTTTEYGSPTGTADNESAEKMYLGNMLSDLNSTFDGTLDDVRVYNRILSGEEVKDLYNATKGVTLASSQAVVPGSTLQSGLVGYWSFNGLDVTDKVYDRSGQNNHGYFEGGATNTAKVGGKVGQALQFGTGKEVKALLDLTDKTAITLSMWVRTNAWTYDDSIFAMEWISQALYTVSIGPEGDCDVVNKMWVGFRSNAGGNTKCYPPLPEGEWLHLVFTGDLAQSPANEIGTFYVNGAPWTPTFSYNDFDNSTGLQDAGLYVGNFDGVVDEVRIYDRVLTPQEVKLLYSLGR
jgi:hypothetical protein